MAGGKDLGSGFLIMSRYLFALASKYTTFYMKSISSLIAQFGCAAIIPAIAYFSNCSSVLAASFVNSISIPGNATDLANTNNPSANTNRLGGFGSDLYFDPNSNFYYGLVDRGPGGGVIPYQTRVQQFSLNVNQSTGAISDFVLQNTILLTKDGQSFNGLNPNLLNRDSSNLGKSQDPEGFVVAPNGNFYISDEYGPSVREFRPDGSFVREFTVPSNLVPKQSDGTINYVNGRPTITSGRQDNRGFEGLAMSPDGSKLYGLLQDPLVNEGDSNDGRRSRNVRMVEYDTATGQSTAQFIYQLEAIADINNRIPGTTNDFTATQQGRSIGISSVIAINDKEFFVIERDNRGIGVDDPTGINPVGSKRIYKIDITGATDVSNISLAGTSSLPGGIKAVAKSSNPFIDIAAALTQAGLTIPEKIEGVTIGPRLADGTYALIVATDNDFSVTQTGSGTQLDVCSNGMQVAIDSGCPNGSSLIPSLLYSFKADVSGYVRPVPFHFSVIPSIVMSVSLAAYKLKKKAK